MPDKIHRLCAPSWLITRIALILVFLAAGIQPLCADFFADDAGSFAFDLPEGFVTVSSSNGNAWNLRNKGLPVEFAARSYSKAEMGSARDAMKTLHAKLNARGDMTEFAWRGQNCAISQITMTPQGYEQPQAGWALAVPLPETGGVIAAVIFSPAQYAGLLDRFMLSALDSLYIDQESWFVPGPVTTFAYPESGQKETALNIEGTRAAVTTGADDAEAAGFVIEREFAVLAMYGGTEFAPRAWQRYYRQIYRDSYGRLKNAALGITAALTAGGRAGDDATLLQTLLSWTQAFPYERNLSASDFTALPSLLEGGGSDCDSRAMLLCVILNAAGYNAVFFFSPEYSHALFGVEINLPGAKIAVGGKQYLLCETTARVSPGLIAAEMNDSAKWIPVVFPQ